MKTEYIYGIHAVETLLKKHMTSAIKLYYQSTRNDKRLGAILTLAAEQNIHTESADKKTLEKLVDDANHQGIILEIKSEKSTFVEQDLPGFIENLTEPAFLLVLDGVQDPHNLGACLRSADAAGVHAVIMPKDRAASVTPVVRKVASGAAESVPVFQVTNLVRTLKKLKDQGLWIVGATGEASNLVYEIDLQGPIAIVAGNEGDGMRRLTKNACDYLVKLPMHGVVSSLNVSVAVGVLLYEAVRQRL